MKNINEKYKSRQPRHPKKTRDMALYLNIIYEDLVKYGRLKCSSSNTHHSCKPLPLALIVAACKTDCSLP